MTTAAGRRALITGIGAINAAGLDIGSSWQSLLDGKSAIGPITRFDAAGLQVSLAAEVGEFRPPKEISRRLLAKSDRFAHLALAATAHALADSGVDLAEEDPFRIGISFGNNSGGWDICERGFAEYYQQGPPMINPWQATAWFPTAPQGFVSIQYNVRGWSKSFACDRASGGCAAYFGLRALQWGHNDLMLVGGSEAPVTRLGIGAHVSTGELSRSTEPERAYLPYSPAATGLVLGEGSAVLVVEEAERAAARGARAYGELLAVEQRTGAPEDGSVLEDTLRSALAKAGTDASDVDLILGEGCGSPAADRAEADVLHRVLPGVPVTVPKATVGHMYGASTATDIAFALQAMRDAILPPTAGAQLDGPERYAPVSATAVERTVNTAVVVSRSREGTNVVTVISKHVTRR
jgi:3-oxoacyl-(acyl-carrier-protein) synthase